MCGDSASLTRDEYLTNAGISVISPGNRVFKNSSCTRRSAFSRRAKCLARVDFAAAILPQKKISSAGLRMLDFPYLTTQAHRPGPRDAWIAPERMAGFAAAHG